MKQEKIYIIGNGFDLHHSLKTKYSDFKEFLEEKNKVLVQKIDSVFSEKGYKNDEVKLWSTLEEMLISLSYIDDDEIFQESFDNSEDDMDRASYWHDPKFNADKIAEDLLIPLEMKKHFDEWIETINIESIKKDYKLSLSKKSYYLCFNYTDTLQRKYNIPESQVLHIHGKKGQDYILGHNGAEELPFKGNLWYPYENEDGELTSDEDIRTVEVKESINDTYSSLFRQYYKNSIKLIDEYKEWFKKFQFVNKVIIMGLSFGQEDMIYFKKIVELVPSTCKFIIYYYGSNMNLINNIGNILDKHKVQYVKW